MMDSKDSALTPSIVISPADGCFKDDFNNLYTALALTMTQTTTTSSSSGHETYEFKRTKVRHYSTSSEPSLSPEKTVESQTSSPTETTLVAEDVVSAESDLGTNCAPSSPTAAMSPSTATSPTTDTSPEATSLARHLVFDQQGSTTAHGHNGDCAPNGTPAPESFAYDSQSRNTVSGAISSKDRRREAIAENRAEDGWVLQALSSSPPNNSPSNSSRSSVHVGLVNQAMTCYLNSLIQALYMTPEFRNALYKWEFTGSNEEEQHSIPYHLQKLFLNLQTSQRNAVETTKLTRSFGWDSSEAWHQHDIQELCRVMFEALERKFSNTDQADFIQRLYEGKMLDYVKCLECCKEKSRTDSFLDIPLPVKPFGNSVAYETIEEALDGFVQAETLDGNNQYFCETCNKKCDAQKGLKFSHFPYILTLHLKRFDFDYNTMHRIKLNDKVSFPEVLNLNDFIGACEDGPTCSNSNTDSAMCDLNSTCSTNGDGCSVNGCQNCNDSEMCCCSDADEGIDEATKSDSKSCPVHKNERNRGSPGPYKYELFSIMIHSGSASGGHYFAYIKDFDTNEWFCFNDDVVSPISHEDIVENFCSNSRNRYSVGFSSTPYMLMYRQIDKKKNASFMKMDGFPDHIKKLVEVVQKEDGEQRNRRLVRRHRERDVYDSEARERSATFEARDNYRDREPAQRTCAIQVIFDQVIFDQVASKKKTVRRVSFTLDDTLGDFLNLAANSFSITDVPLQKLRLAACTPGTVPIYEEIDVDFKERVENLLPCNPEVKLVLYIEEDASESGFVSVRIVSCDSSELMGLPVNVDISYTKGMTIGELKKKMIKFTGEIPVNHIFIGTNRVYDQKEFNDDTTVQTAKTQCPKFYAVYNQRRVMDLEEVRRCVAEIVDRDIEDEDNYYFPKSRGIKSKRESFRAAAWKMFSLNDASIASAKMSEEKDAAAANLDLKSIARSEVQDHSFVTNSSHLENGHRETEENYEPIVRVHFYPDGCEKKTRQLLYSDETLGDFLTVAADLFSITGVPLQKLRLAANTPGNAPIYEEIKGDLNERVENLFPYNTDFDLVLYIEEDASESGAVSVQIVSFDSSELVGLPIDVEFAKGMTIGQLKEKLTPYIGETPVNQIFIGTNRKFARKVFSDDTTVQQAKTLCPEFFAAYSQKHAMDIKEVHRCISEILNRKVVEVKCKLLGISRSLLTRFGTNAREIAKSDWRKKVLTLSSSQNGECSNVNNASITSAKMPEDKDGAAANLNLKSIARSDEQYQNLPANSSPLEKGTDDTSGLTPVISNFKAKEDASDNVFTVQHIDENNPELTLSVSSVMKVSTFKAILAQFVGVPETYIKLHSHLNEKKECALLSFPIGELAPTITQKLFVKIVKPRATDGAVYWKIHKLCQKPWVAVYLFDCGMSKSVTVAQAKKIILEEMKERGFDVLPLERCRLRDVMGSRPRNVFLDHLTLRELYCTSYCIVVQELEGPEPVERPSQNLVLVRNFDRKEEDLGKELVLENVALSVDSPNLELEAFFDKLSSETDIPVDNLDVRVLFLSSACCRTWRRDDFEDKPLPKLIESGHAFYYRDNRVSIEDQAVQYLWDGYVLVKEYLEEKTKLELATLTENSSEKADEKGSPKSKRRVKGKPCAKDQLLIDEHENNLCPPRNEESSSVSNVSNHVESSSESRREQREFRRDTPVKSYRSRERGLKIYVEPTPQRSTPEPTTRQENHKDGAEEAVKEGL